MANQLRKGVELLRNYYIKKIMKFGMENTSENQLHSLTLSELEKIFRKLNPHKN